MIDPQACAHQEVPLPCTAAYVYLIVLSASKVSSMFSPTRGLIMTFVQCPDAKDVVFMYACRPI